MDSYSLVLIMFFDIIKSIYLKEKKEYEINTQLNITLSRWLSYDEKNLPYLKKILHYLFYINSKHYYYLLFFIIPKGRVPFLKKIEKQKKKEDKLMNRIKKILSWTDRELEFNRNILENLDKKYWGKELGIK